jgi:methanesulfonate monooxygenase subunit beta
MNASVHPPPIPRDAVERVVYRSCMLLDDRDFPGYLALCDPDFRYRITAHSPEIRKDMVWLDHDRRGMETLFTNLPRHNSDHSPLTRHATLYTLDIDEGTGEARTVSALQVFKTALDGGATELFAVGRYIDTLRLAPDRASARLLSRTVKLDTRMLGIGYHVPF